MGLTEGTQTAHDRSLRVLDALLAGEASGNDSEHDRKQVFGPMLNFACQQFLPNLGLFPVTDVADDLEGADDLPCSIPYGRYAKRDINQTPILALADGLIVVDALAASKLVQNFHFL